MAANAQILYQLRSSGAQDMTEDIEVRLKAENNNGMKEPCQAQGIMGFGVGELSLIAL